MTDAREIEGFCTDCGNWTNLHGPIGDRRCRCGSGRVAVPPAGYRIIGPDEIDPVTVGKCAEVAERLAEERKEKEQKIGGWPWTATPVANHFWCEEIAAAIRSLGEGR